MRLSCDIILHYIEIIENCTDIYNKNKELILDEEKIGHKIYYTYEKRIPKEEITKAFKEIGNEVFGYINDTNINYDDILGKNKIFNALIPINYYFNEGKEIFVEAFSDNNNYYLTREKFISDFLFDFFEYFAPINIENYEISLKNKLKINFCNKLFELIESNNIRIDNKNLSFYIEKIEPFYKIYYNYIKSFFNNILEAKIYPSFADFELDIKTQFKEYFYSFLYPSLIFNINLYIFANNENNYFQLSEKDCCNMYVNFDEL